MFEEKSLTPQEVADLLKIAKTTVYEMIKRGDIPCYRIGRKVRVNPADVERFRKMKTNCVLDQPPVKPQEFMSGASSSESLSSAPRGCIIAGQDFSLDILARQLEARNTGVMPLRSYISSYNGLVALYRGELDAASVHLWDEKTGSYNDSFVRYLLPGIPAVLIHIAKRKVGFYVQKGNPGGIKGWKDLARDDVTIINREKGSGVRVLLDQKLQKEGINPLLIKGYQRESQSHLAAASIVSQGGADVAVGCEKIASQARDVDFIPIQNERYDLVVRKSDFQKPHIHALLDVISSEEYTAELQGFGGYDLSETGSVREIS